MGLFMFPSCERYGVGEYQNGKGDVGKLYTVAGFPQTWHLPPVNYMKIKAKERGECEKQSWVRTGVHWTAVQLRDAAEYGPSVKVTASAAGCTGMRV